MAKIDSKSRRLPAWKYVGALSPFLIVWLSMVGWLAYLLYAQSNWGQKYDEESLREWIEESRIAGHTLRDATTDYTKLLQQDPDRSADLKAIDQDTPLLPTDDSVRIKAKEVADFLKALAEPSRIFQTQMPLFPEIYSLEAGASEDGKWKPFAAWHSPVPRPRMVAKEQNGSFRHILANGIEIQVEYRLHAYNTVERADKDQRREEGIGGGVVLGGSTIAAIWLSLFLRRERNKELMRMRVDQAREHAVAEALAERLRAEQAERNKEELDRKLLQQRLEAAKQEQRASEAENNALEMKSQIYAGIGIMAGSYAHNIKNLLVRPNDLLARCLETDGLAQDQTSMLQEVRTTLGTVTERLQQILKTVRRDPGRAEMTRLDLVELARETEQTWAGTARDKWKLFIKAELPAEPLHIRGDASHLQQAMENLVFNARDATFEMRNRVRDDVRSHRPHCSQASDHRRRGLARPGPLAGLSPGQPYCPGGKRQRHRHEC